MSFPKHDGSLLPPQALDLERVILGTCFVVPGAVDVVSAKIMAEDFYSMANREVYQIILDLYNENSPIDVVAVSSRAEHTGKTELIEYVFELVENICALENLDYYIGKVIAKAKLRSIINISGSVFAQSNKSDKDDEIIEQAASDLQNAINDRSGSKILCANQMVVATIDDMHYRHQGKVMGYTTGIKSLDEVVGEFSKGDLIVIAGRPSMGKTAIATSIMLNQLQQGVKVGFLSLEMRTKAIGYRMVSALTGLNLFKVMHGMTPRHEAHQLYAAFSKISEMSFWIDDTPNLTAMKVRALTRQMITVYGIQILYIDHLAKMDVGDDEYHGLTKATKLISAGAKDMDIPIVLLHQLRRSDDKKKEHRPTLQHLRGSGAIEQDADTVIFVHREEYYTHKDEDKGVAELIVAKQRNGPTETAICEFVAQSAHFRDTKPPEF